MGQTLFVSQILTNVGRFWEIYGQNLVKYWSKSSKNLKEFIVNKKHVSHLIHIYNIIFMQKKYNL